MNETDAKALIVELFDSVYPALVRFLAHALRDVGAAEDIAQDALMKLYETLRRAGAVEHPRAWLFAVARRDAVVYQQQRGRMVAEVDGDTRWMTTDQTAALDAAADLRQMLGLLSLREAEVLMLRAGALKHREIAAELGINVKTVGVLLIRALRKLQTAFGAVAPEEKLITDVETKRRPPLQ